MPNRSIPQGAYQSTDSITSGRSCSRRLGGTRRALTESLRGHLRYAVLDCLSGWETARTWGQWPDCQRGLVLRCNGLLQNAWILPTGRKRSNPQLRSESSRKREDAYKIPSCMVLLEDSYVKPGQLLIRS